MNNKNLCKRLGIGALLGALAGLLCFYGFSSNPEIPAEMAQFQQWSWGNIMIWSTVTNRLAIGFAVGLAGFMTTHPLFGFKIPVFLRGIMIGILISLSMAFGAIIGSEETSVFWLILIAGAIIGMIIDLIVTKIAGQGKDLIKE